MKDTTCGFSAGHRDVHSADCIYTMRERKAECLKPSHFRPLCLHITYALLLDLSVSQDGWGLGLDGDIWAQLLTGEEQFHAHDSWNDWWIRAGKCPAVAMAPQEACPMSYARSGAQDSLASWRTPPSGSGPIRLGDRYFCTGHKIWYKRHQHSTLADFFLVPWNFTIIKIIIILPFIQTHEVVQMKHAQFLICQFFLNKSVFTERKCGSSHLNKVSDASITN